MPLREAAYSVDFARSPFTARTVGNASHIRLTVAGEIDVLNADQFDAALDAALDDSGRHLWVDLSAVEFLGAAALHSLVRAGRQVAATRRRMIIICPAGEPRRVLELVGLEAEIPMFPHPSSVPRTYQ